VSRLRHSLGTRVAVAFAVIITVLLVLFNTYFLTKSRDMIFTSKQTMLQRQSATITTSLTTMDSLNLDNVSQLMEILDVQSATVHATIVTPGGEVIYDSSGTNNIYDIQTVSDNINTSLEGNAVFYANFSDGAFHSSLFTPIVLKNGIAGVLILTDIDADEGNVLLLLQGSVKTLTLIVAAVTVAVIVVIVYTIASRINTILRGIKPVREGQYSYRINIRGKDELADLAREFNLLAQRLEDNEKIRRRFVADASHELKTPLASIRLLSDSILQTESIDSETIHEFVGDISNEAERLARITERLLALTKLDNKIAVKRSRVEMGAAAMKAERILRPIADSRGIKMTVKAEGECYVFSSEDELLQLIINLMENAIKYNNDGGSVYVNAARSGDNVVFTVDDTGVGVPESDLPHIFDRFYRVDKARSREAGGSGLGLSIVKATVTELHGTVDAHRREEGGMSFRICLPVCNENMTDNE
jgi:signal transduction histidine kinase